MNWYNEFEPYPAQWLRNQIDDGQLAPGVVDERDIRDVCPAELVSFDECHFFCGIGIWPRALRDAELNVGRRLRRPVWTGSCPCQPFSQAGRGEGFDDERHLWPSWHWLIEQSAPSVILGEQVEGPDGLMWLDLVFSDLEAGGYTCGATVFPAAGVGAPHIRSRTYWVADHERERPDRSRRDRGDGQQLAGARPWGDRLDDSAAGLVVHANDARPQGRPRVPERADQRVAGSGGMAGELADADEGERRRRTGDDQGDERHRQAAGRFEGDSDASRDYETGGMADAPRQRAGREFRLSTQSGAPSWPGPVNGVWRDADWIFCRDGFWRPIEPGSFPLAHGSPARTGRLRAYGNAICLPQATAFIEEILMMERFNE